MKTNNNITIAAKIKALAAKLTATNDNINYDEVANYFKDENNKTNNKYSWVSDNSKLENVTTIDSAFTTALEFTNEIKKSNMSLDEIINKLKKEVPKFKIVYERTINKTLLQIDNNHKAATTNNENISLPFSSEEEKKLKEEAAKFWDQLSDIRKGLATAIAISPAAGAGFWAAAWLGVVSASPER